MELRTADTTFTVGGRVKYMAFPAVSLSSDDTYSEAYTSIRTDCTHDRCGWYVCGNLITVCYVAEHAILK